jgi:lipoyl(octanoyl) transferase
MWAQPSWRAQLSPDRMHIHLLQLGRIPYLDGLRIQAEVVAARKAQQIGDTLILLEHPPVLTLGRNATRANILASERLLLEKGVGVHEVNRGGDVTYHGPGQLIGYPIFDLRGDFPGKRGPHLGPVDFVRLMEEALILTCKDFGIPAQRICKLTGVWTLAGGTISEKKIAAIGVHVSQAITSHGFALNVSTDLRDFDWIVPCGITDRTVTSLELESSQTLVPTLEKAANSISANFGRIFQRQILAAPSLEELLAIGTEQSVPIST